MSILKAGCKAYYDTISAGLIPGVCVSVFKREDGFERATIRLTRDGGPYKRGETIESTTTWIVPRDVVRKGKYFSTVGHYETELTEGQGNAIHS